MKSLIQAFIQELTVQSQKNESDGIDFQISFKSGSAFQTLASYQDGLQYDHEFPPTIKKVELSILNKDPEMNDLVEFYQRGLLFRSKNFGEKCLFMVPYENIVLIEEI